MIFVIDEYERHIIVRLSLREGPIPVSKINQALQVREFSQMDQLIHILK